MTGYKIVKVHKELIPQASKWFHEKWGIPQSAYIESMEESLDNTLIIPKWYVVYDKADIIGGAGVIDNDFHKRKDLSPNLCALYVEEGYRNQGVAGTILQFITNNLALKGIHTLYLVTDHTSFYEKYAWEFLAMVQGDDGELTRIYTHKL